MTAGAQQALRRIMEIHAPTTRFALACNNSTKIIEPIQSRCAILRYGRLTPEQVSQRLHEVAQAEGVAFNAEGMEALVFTADGDMRQAINNLQATVSGFGYVNAENVFKVCDQPHPALIDAILEHCTRGEIEQAHQGLEQLWSQGYAAVDLVTTFFRVARALPPTRLAEGLLMEYLKEIGLCHMRILEGNATRLQLAAMLAALCRLTLKPELFTISLK